MKKVIIFLFTVLVGVLLIGCDGTELPYTTLNPTDSPGTTDVPSTTEEPTTLPGYQERIPVKTESGCEGNGEFVIINGQCVLVNDILSPELQFSDNVTNVTYLDGVELMDDLIADLSGSTGLAVVPRELFAQQVNMTLDERVELLQLSSVQETDTENVIVKLKEDGFFEEVSFSDALGYEVSIDSNPLALEVFGDYTVIVFEILFDWDDGTRDFHQKVYDSLYAGGVYLIHNQSGKLFSTSIIDYTEDTYVEYDFEYEHIITTANVGEPVTREVKNFLYDENEEPILDENGEHTYELSQEVVLDYDGNPYIFEDGPIVTEINQFPVTETFMELVYDDNGEPLLDEFGEPVYQEVTQPVVDENGNPVYYEEEVAVLDEFGEVIYQTDFEVEIIIENKIEITHTTYHANVSQGPLFELSRRFVDRIIESYFNWSYYRVHDYQIGWGFAESGEYIYYLEDKDDPSYDTIQKFIMRLSFDSDTNELLIEEYLNASKAGFVNGEIILDPNTNIILWKDYMNETNIKIYSSTLGLSSIPDSVNYNIHILPNDELFLVNRDAQYVEALGYTTRAMYRLNSDGTLEEHFIELGEVVYYSENTDTYNSWSPVDIYQDGVMINLDYQRHISIPVSYGSKVISSTNLDLISISEFDSTRPVCEDVDGCEDNITYLFYMGETLVGTQMKYIKYYPDDTPPPYSVSYQLNTETTFNYLYDQVSENVSCETTDLECNDEFYIRQTIDGYNYMFRSNVLVNNGESLIQYIDVLDTNNGIYEYTKTEYSNICEFDQCEALVEVNVYDLENNIISKQNRTMNFTNGDQIPLLIEYRMSDDTTITTGSVCSTTDGCYKWYNTFDGHGYSVQYQYGDLMYQDIVFVETDRTYVLEKTYTSEICSETNGCYIEDITYIINDDEGKLLYETKENAWAQYGDRLPYKVTLTLADVHITYETQLVSYPILCEETTCSYDISVYQDTTLGNTYVGTVTIKLNLDDQLISSIYLDEGKTYFDSTLENLCMEKSGCIVYTNNYIVLDELGNDVTSNPNNDYLVMKFAEGEAIPVIENPEATYQMRDVVYQMRRVNPSYIFNYMDNFTILEDNTYFIKRPSWSHGDLNFILKYNEVEDSYFASYTNLPFVHEIAELGNGYVGINNDKTAIFYFELNLAETNESYYHYDVVNLTADYEINAVSNLIIDYDGSIYFEAVDNFIQDITGKILDDGTITIDTVYTEYEIVRVRPLN